MIVRRALFTCLCVWLYGRRAPPLTKKVNSLWWIHVKRFYIMLWPVPKRCLRSHDTCFTIELRYPRCWKRAFFSFVLTSILCWLDFGASKVTECSASNIRLNKTNLIYLFLLVSSYWFNKEWIFFSWHSELSWLCFSVHSCHSSYAVDRSYPFMILLFPEVAKKVHLRMQFLEFWDSILNDGDVE